MPFSIEVIWKGVPLLLYEITRKGNGLYLNGGAYLIVFANPKMGDSRRLQDKKTTKNPPSNKVLVVELNGVMDNSKTLIKKLLFFFKPGMQWKTETPYINTHVLIASTIY